MEMNDEIDDFLQGKLKGEALETFTKRIEEDEEFGQLVKEQAELKQSIVYSNRLAMKKRLEEIDRKEKSGYVFRIAASISLLAVASYLLWINFSTSNSEEVFLAYYEPLSELEVPPSRGNSKDVNLIASAFEHYTNEQYDEVRNILDQTSDQQPFISYANFIRGLIWIGEEKYSKATEVFDLALQIKTPIYEDVLWYRALCYIQLNQIDKAKDDLNMLMNSKYSERAAEIVNRIGAG